MKKQTLAFPFFLFYLFLFTSNWSPLEAPINYQGEKMKGISLVGPPNPFKADPMLQLQQVGVDWVGVIPFAYSPLGSTTVNYDREGKNYQWWGETPEGALQAIHLAKAKNMKIMLKPQLYVPNGWPGAIDFKTDAEWKRWEQQYEDFILFFADMAQEQQVDLLCIGTEFKIALQERTRFWLNLVDKIKSRYKGPLTYAANWDEFYEVPSRFWRKMDYIGIDAYFPLLEDKTPTVAQLTKAWIPKRESIRAFYLRVKKPILFTEFGYLTVDGCAWQAWELEKVVRGLPVNEQAQANAIDAILQTFWEEFYWAGSFYWKWFPNMQGISDYPERDYSPQGKKGEMILAKWYLER